MAQVLSSGIRALWRKSLYGGLSGLALRNQGYSLQELRPILKLLVDFGRRQPDTYRSSPLGSSIGSSSSGGGTTPISPPAASGNGGGGSSSATAGAAAAAAVATNRRMHNLLMLSSANGLAWLDLSGNALGDTGAATLIRLLATSGNSRLRGLDLSNNCIVDGEKFVTQLATPIDLVTNGACVPVCVRARGRAGSSRIAHHASTMCVRLRVR